jgi:uncharacterized coiled-coil DUF342 family protein
LRRTGKKLIITNKQIKRTGRKSLPQQKIEACRKNIEAYRQTIDEYLQTSKTCWENIEAYRQNIEAYRQTIDEYLQTSKTCWESIEAYRQTIHAYGNPIKSQVPHICWCISGFEREIETELESAGKRNFRK